MLKSFERAIEAMGVEALAAELQYLRISHMKLRESNLQLFEFIKEDNDADLLLAFEENKGVLKRQLEKMRLMVERMVVLEWKDVNVEMELLVELERTLVPTLEAVEVKTEKSEERKDGIYL